MNKKILGNALMILIVYWFIFHAIWCVAFGKIPNISTLTFLSGKVWNIPFQSWHLIPAYYSVSVLIIVLEWFYFTIVKKDKSIIYFIVSGLIGGTIFSIPFIEARSYQTIIESNFLLGVMPITLCIVFSIIGLLLLGLDKGLSLFITILFSYNLSLFGYYAFFAQQNTGEIPGYSVIYSIFTALIVLIIYGVFKGQERNQKRLNQTKEHANTQFE
jgi:hypothetical protein